LFSRLSSIKNNPRIFSIHTPFRHLLGVATNSSPFTESTMMIEDNDETTTATPKTRKPKAATDEAAAAESTTGIAESAVLKAANARMPLKTPRGTMLRLDFLGVSLQGHPEEGACNSDPCPKCRHSRSVRLTQTNEVKPDSLLQWTDRNYPGEFSYSASGLSRTPRTERVQTYVITGFSRKFVQTCGCGLGMGHVWQNDPAFHGLTLVEIYHRF